MQVSFRWVHRALTLVSSLCCCVIWSTEVTHSARNTQDFSTCGSKVKQVVSICFQLSWYSLLGTKFAKKNFGGTNLILLLWWDKPIYFAFRWPHHIHSTVVRPFCKIGQIRAHYGIDIFWWPYPPSGYAHSSACNGAIQGPP